jgi:hypothetical protein
MDILIFLGPVILGLGVAYLRWRTAVRVDQGAGQVAQATVELKTITNELKEIAKKLRGDGGPEGG